MKTLVICGSPRIHGDTRRLVDLFCQNMSGEIRILDVYRSSISGCMDCRYCWEHAECALQDEMQEQYAYMEDCDCILLASPVYFSELTGKLLDVMSRLQRYFCARFFRKEELIGKPKKGAILLLGGGDGNPDRALATAQTLLHQMRVDDIAPAVIYHNTNITPAIEDECTRRAVIELAEFFTRDEREVKVRNIGPLPLHPDRSEIRKKLLQTLEGKE